MNKKIEFFHPEEVAAWNNNVSAADRRKVGSRALAAMNAFQTKAQRAAKLARKPVEAVYMDMLANNPQAVQNIANYVGNRGYVPHPDLEKLCAQAAWARGQHINEVVDRYDAEGFEEADGFFLDSKERKEARRARRKAKFARRAERREKKHRNKMAALDAEYKQALEGPQAEPQETPQQEPETDTTEDTFDPEYYEVVEVENFEDYSGLSSPTLEVAHAEIIGEEFEGDSYEGGADNFLPFLAGAITIGSKMLSGEKVDKEEFKDLFRKKANKKMPPQLPKGATTASVLNEGMKKMMQSVESKKKSDFLKENWIWILLAIVVIFIAGKSFSKHD